ncbi:MAG: 3-hydroxyacyl-CoA dehydrogenase family protein [Deltaproteobacteria bacterium]|nr:3-hydroxyacyl-CoA dehydrogenase family protein [Deltaproteobacteria bacterium]MBW2396072.1 3-hydroxyacyl-CoA dehydrogenase family protein [Deltaproteobacteria bacterium]
MSASQQLTPAEVRKLVGSRKIEHVVVLGANGTMGYGSGALFTTVVPKVTFLARTKAKAEEGLGAAVKQVRSPTVASRVEVGDYDHEFDAAVADADLIFEALTEDFDVKKAIFDKVEKVRRDDSIVATVTSGLSINALCEGRGDSFRKNFLGLHFFNPPNVIVGTELIPGDDTDPELVDFIEAYSRARLGREIIRTADTPAFAGNRVGFKVLNEAAQLAEEHGPVLIDRLIGPYTGRAMTPLATIDLVGWDIHRAIVDNVYEKTQDEAHETNKLPAYMDKLMERGVLGNKTGRGFFWKEDKVRHVLDPVSGDYKPEAEVNLPDLSYIDDVSALYSQGRYAEGIQIFLGADGEYAALARKVIAGYISYAFHRVGEVTETISGVDRIMGMGFNWAPPSVLVDTMGKQAAVDMIAKAGLPVPSILEEAARSGSPKRFFQHPHINPGRFFVAS